MAKIFGVIFGLLKIVTSFSFFAQLLESAAAKYGEREMRIAECALNILVFGASPTVIETS